MSTCWIENVDPAAACSCGDCDWTGKASQLQMISDIQERIDAGSTVPAGECPACGALAYVDEEPSRDALELAELRRLLRTIAPHAETFAQDWRSGLEDGTYEERAGLDYLEQALERWDELEKGAAPVALPAPVYVIGVEGGVVQGMSTNRGDVDPPSIIVCDWDARDDEGLEIGDGRANVYAPGAVLEAEFVASVLEAISQADAGAQADALRLAEDEADAAAAAGEA